MNPKSVGSRRGMKRSGIGEDLFAARKIEPVDAASADESPIVENVVVRRTGAGPTPRGDRFPHDIESLAEAAPDAAVDPSGDDPLDIESVGQVGLDNHDGARVLDPQRVDAVDGIGTGQPGSGVAVSGQFAGQRAEVQHQSESEKTSDSGQQMSGLHGDESRQTRNNLPEAAADDRLVIPRWLKILTGVFVVFVAAAMAFAIFEPIQVLPRVRLAPGYSMVDQNGDRFTSETVRGEIVVYAFTSLTCGESCDQIDLTMAQVGSQVRDEVDFGDIGFRLVTVVLDAGESPDDLAAATVEIPDDVSWSWISNDADTMSTVVGSGFRRYLDASDPNDVRFDPGFIIVDGSGVVRGDYRYQTLADEADKLVRHLDILAGELRHADGPAGAAYEAAHLFLCYP